MKKVIPLFLLMLLTVACSLEIQKRHYRSGYHLSISKKYQQHKKSSVATTSTKKFKPSSADAVAYNPLLITTDLHEQLYPARNGFQNTSDTRYTSFIKHTEKTSKGTTNNYNRRGVTSKEIKSNVTIQPNKSETENSKNKKSDNWFLVITMLTAAFFTGIFKPSIPKTRKVGYWALNHRKTSRVLHFVAHTILAGCGLFVGKQLHEFGVLTTESTTHILAGVAAFFALFYPARKHTTGIFKNTYTKQKLFALAMVLSGFALFINIGNRYAAHDWKYSPNYKNPVLTASSSPFGIIRNFQDDNKEDSDKAAKIVFTVLTCIIGMLLTLLIVGASCSLSCSGQGALSVLVLIIGVPLLIIGTVALTKSIWKPKKVNVNTP